MQTARVAEVAMDRRHGEDRTTRGATPPPGSGAGAAAGRRRRTWRRWAGVARVTLALACAAGIGAAVTRGADPERRAERVAALRAEADGRATAVGVATVGTAYLQVPTSEPTATASWQTLAALDRGIDPATYNGTLYPLRKGLEQLAGMLIFPLIIASVLHALVTARGEADSKLRDLAINFFVVTCMLWIYPAWDYMLYRRVAIPLTEQLSNGPSVAAVARAIGDKTAGGAGASAYESDVNARFSPSGELSAFWQNDLACPVEIAAAKGTDPNAGRRCADGTVPATRQVSHARSAQGLMLGNAAQKDSAMSQKPSWWKDAWTKAMEWGRGAATEVNSVMSFDLGQWIEGNIGNWLAESIGGILLTIQSALAAAILWFVWLAVIVGRAMSLCLAPIAIVWGLMPGSNAWAKPKKWFTKHAELSLMPVGVAFGMLVYWAVMTSIMATPIMTDVIIGIALKIALFIGFVFAAFRTSNLTNMLAGDVTEVATDFGKSVRNATIAVAGTGAALTVGALGGGFYARAAATQAARAGGAAAGAAGAGGAAGGGAGTVVSNGGAAGQRVAQTAQRLAQTTGALGTAASGGGAGVANGAASGASAGGGAGGGNGGGAGTAATSASRWRRFGSAIGRARGRLSPTGALGPANPGAGSATNSPPPSRVGRMMRRGGAVVASAVQNEWEVLQWAWQHRVSMRDAEAITGGDVGLAMRRTLVEPVSRAASDWRRLRDTQQALRASQLAAQNRRRQQAGLRSGGAVGGAGVGSGGGSGRPPVPPGGGGNSGGGGGRPPVPPGGAAGRPATAQSAGAVSPSATGSAPASVAVSRGAAGAAQNAMASGGIAANGARGGNTDRGATSGFSRIEAQRQQRVITAGAVPGTSVQAAAMVGLEPRYAEQQAGEADDAYATRLRGAATRVLRQTWYIHASESEREGLGLPRVGGESAAATAAQIDVGRWETPDSLAVLTPTELAALAQVLAAHRIAITRALGREAFTRGRRYGIAAETFVATDGRDERYTYQEGSVLDAVLEEMPQLAGRMAEAYAEARRRIEADDALRSRVPASPATGESAEDFQVRREAMIQRLVFLSELVLREEVASAGIEAAPAQQITPELTVPVAPREASSAAAAAETGAGGSALPARAEGGEETRPDVSAAG